MTQRAGDTTAIPGDYQYRALTQGNAVQRFWHYSKQLAIKQFLPPSPSDVVVDIGCGSGVITSFLGESGATVLGIDNNPEAIQFARGHFSRPNVKFHLGLVEEFNPAHYEPVDKIYCLELIEHIYLHQARELLKNFYHLLKPRGKVFLTTPNYHSPWPLLEWLMDKARLAPPLSEHQHVERYHSKKLRALAEDGGFRIEKMATMCQLAPWAAPIRWTLAERIHGWESRSPLAMGCILIAILVKPSADSESSFPAQEGVKNKKRSRQGERFSFRARGRGSNPSLALALFPLPTG